MSKGTNQYKKSLSKTLRQTKEVVDNIIDDIDISEKYINQKNLKVKQRLNTSRQPKRKNRLRMSTNQDSLSLTVRNNDLNTVKPKRINNSSSHLIPAQPQSSNKLSTSGTSRRKKLGSRHRYFRSSVDSKPSKVCSNTFITEVKYKEMMNATLQSFDIKTLEESTENQDYTPLEDTQLSWRKNELRASLYLESWNLKFFSKSKLSHDRKISHYEREKFRCQKKLDYLQNQNRKKLELLQKLKYKDLKIWKAINFNDKFSDKVSEIGYDTDLQAHLKLTENAFIQEELEDLPPWSPQRKKAKAKAKSTKRKMMEYLSNAHPQEKQKPILAKRLREVKNSIDSQFCWDQKGQELDKKQLLNIKERLKEELRVFSQKVNAIEPEILAYEREENTLKRINFLVSSRNNVQAIRELELKDKIELKGVKQKLLSDLNDEYTANNTDLALSFEPEDTTFRLKHESDVRTVKNLSKEFCMIDKLIFLLHISTYSNKKGGDKKFTFNSTSRIQLFNQLKSLFQDHKKLLNPKTGLSYKYQYNEDIFEYSEYLKIFMEDLHKYETLWDECKHLTQDDLYGASTRCIETVIEMNSRTGQYQYLNAHIKDKRDLYEHLKSRRDLYKIEHKKSIKVTVRNPGEHFIKTIDSQTMMENKLLRIIDTNVIVKNQFFNCFAALKAIKVCSFDKLRKISTLVSKINVNGGMGLSQDQLNPTNKKPGMCIRIPKKHSKTKYSVRSIPLTPSSIPKKKMHSGEASLKPHNPKSKYLKPKGTNFCQRKSSNTTKNHLARSQRVNHTNQSSLKPSIDSLSKTLMGRIQHLVDGLEDSDSSSDSSGEGEEETVVRIAKITKDIKKIIDTMEKGIMHLKDEVKLEQNEGYEPDEYLSQQNFNWYLRRMVPASINKTKIGRNKIEIRPAKSEHRKSLSSSVRVLNKESQGTKISKPETSRNCNRICVSQERNFRHKAIETLSKFEKEETKFNANLFGKISNFKKSYSKQKQDQYNIRAKMMFKRVPQKEDSDNLNYSKSGLSIIQSMLPSMSDTASKASKQSMRSKRKYPEKKPVIKAENSSFSQK
ncbi:unnamed protein product [Moneuplotes crassus]|uniref:Uncharacterized protein n=1 Tax=Euplotes crassus TaxID=5936 RepID=A0AAD1XCY9_EUPCR|nr:unnamed protein product [Moneuplotes crassus]